MLGATCAGKTNGQKFMRNVTDGGRRDRVCQRASVRKIEVGSSNPSRCPDDAQELPAGPPWDVGCRFDKEGPGLLRCRRGCPRYLCIWLAPGVTSETSVFRTPPRRRWYRQQKFAHGKRAVGAWEMSLDLDVGLIDKLVGSSSPRVWNSHNRTTEIIV